MEYKTSFILSTGRTGTVLLKNSFNTHYSGWQVVHEPVSSRQQYLFGNFSKNKPILRSLLSIWFLKSRQKYFSSPTEKMGYIEINPMLCPLTDILAQSFAPLRVVHIVRDPKSWITSMSNFRASAMFRNIIDYVPFNNPEPDPKPANWNNLSEQEILMWRWRIYNENILRLKEFCSQYALVLFEDLISPDTTLAQKTLRTIIQTLQIEDEPDVSWFINPSKTNAYQKAAGTDFENWTPQQQEALTEICGDLMKQFRYL